MLRVLTINEADQWDALVCSFAHYDVYYLSGYVKAFQLHGDGEPLLFYGEDNGIRGINVVMKRDIAKDSHFVGKLPEGQYFDFSTPYGYGGWLLEGEGDPIPIFAAYEVWCREHAVVSEFVRYHPVLENHTKTAFAYDVIALGPVIAMDLLDAETIWANFSSKNRNMIRKAQKNGVTIHTAYDLDIYETFRRIYNSTMDKDHAEAYYYFQPSFYESIYRDLSQNAQVFYAQIEDGTPIAASILLVANGRMNYHLSGSLWEYRSLAPTNLLLYEAALWGSEHGCKTLYLGGGVGSGEDNLYQFKKSFYRGEPCRFYIGRKIFLPEQYAKLTAQRGDMSNSSYFPRYRA